MNAQFPLVQQYDTVSILAHFGNKIGNLVALEPFSNLNHQVISFKLALTFEITNTAVEWGLSDMKMKIGVMRQYYYSHTLKHQYS